jgi:glutathione S-transferase
MEIKFSGLSPYVRKVMVVAHELGVAERLTITKINVREEQPKITPYNPLGKVPALITDDGRILFDSVVICEYLDTEFGGHRLLPASGAKRWQVMTTAALADGLIDAAVLIRNERLRPPDRQSNDWIAHQLRKVIGALDQLERDMPALRDDFDLSHVGIGCGLGYVTLRVDEVPELSRWPQLQSWYATTSQRPSFQRTVPVA